MSFDAERFMSMQTEDAMETRRDPTPPGEYRAVIKDIDVKEPKNPESAAKGFNLFVTWDIMDDDLKAQLGREEISILQVLYCTTGESGGLEVGSNRNTQLGQIREAVGQNDAGTPWAINQLRGAGPVLLKLTHRVDKEDSSIVYDNVSRVVAIN